MSRNWRKAVARAMPSMFAGTFVFIIASGSVGNRLLAALGGVLLVPVACALAVLVGYSLFAKVSGDVKDLKSTDFESPYFLGAVLACVLIWGWLQVSKEEAIRRFGECVALEVEQNAPDSIREATAACRHPEPTDDSNEF